MILLNEHNFRFDLPMTAPTEQSDFDYDPVSARILRTLAKNGRMPNQQLAAEVGRKGVNVNALSLGTMNNWEGSEELARKNCIIPRAGSPADVGAGVAWLASREAEWVTGQVYPLNGGALTA